MQQNGQVLNALSQVKEARIKRLNTMLFYWYDFLKKAKVIRTESNSVVSKNQGPEEGLTTNGHRKFWGVMKLFYMFIMADGINFYTVIL